MHLVSATDRCTEQSPQRSMNSKKVHLFMFLTLYENILPFVYIHTYAIMFKCFRFYSRYLCLYVHILQHRVSDFIVLKVSIKIGCERTTCTYKLYPRKRWFISSGNFEHIFFYLYLLNSFQKKSDRLVIFFDYF